MARSLEELQEEYAKKEKKLKEEKEKLLNQAKARAAKKTALERANARKTDAHLKIILGGWLLGEIKKKSDKALLDKISGTLKSDRDKKLLSNLVGTS